MPERIERIAAARAVVISGIARGDDWARENPNGARAFSAGEFRHDGNGHGEHHNCSLCRAVRDAARAESVTMSEVWRGRVQDGMIDVASTVAPVSAPRVESASAIPRGHKQCAGCNRYFARRDMHRIGGRNYCAACERSRFFTCEFCGKVKARRYGVQRIYRDFVNGEAVHGAACRDCASSRGVKRCPCCHGHWVADKVVAPREHFADDVACPLCIERKVHLRIKAHGSKLARKFMRASAAERLLVGFELECDTSAPRVTRDEIVARVQELVSWSYVESDGSLGGEGFEVISNPFSLSFWRKNRAAVKAMLSAIEGAGWRSYDAPSSCGLHLHVSRAALSRLTEWKLFRLFYVFSAFTARLSRRRAADLAQWASTGIGEDTFRHWAFEKTRTGHRYSALNAQRETIEFRFPRGTLSFESFDGWVIIANAAVEFARDASMDKINPVEFCAFVARTPEYKRALPMVRRAAGLVANTNN